MPWSDPDTHNVLYVASSLYNQLAPSDPVGIFVNLPVPSLKDWDSGYASTFNVVAKFLCSVENNSKEEDHVAVVILFSNTS